METGHSQFAVGLEDTYNVMKHSDAINALSENAGVLDRDNFLQIVGISIGTNCVH